MIQPEYFICFPADVLIVILFEYMSPWHLNKVELKTGLLQTRCAEYGVDFVPPYKSDNL